MDEFTKRRKAKTAEAGRQDKYSKALFAMKPICATAPDANYCRS